jgi:hypothetical protein
MMSSHMVFFILAGAVTAMKAGEPPRASKPKTPEPTLLERCRKMRDAQAAVNKRIRGLSEAIRGTPDKEPRPEDLKAARKLAAVEDDLIAQATATIDWLQAQRAAVAFAEVFQELRKDMRLVRDRLKRGNVGPQTQALAQDVAATLNEMILSLKKR